MSSRRTAAAQGRIAPGGAAWGFVGPALILALGIAAYGDAFDGKFVFDCGSNIVQNAGLRDLGEALRSWQGQRWLGYATLALDYRLWGLSVGGYHAFNLAVHLASALTLYALVLVSFRTPVLARSALAPHSSLVAFTAASLFVSHPVQTQAVTYVIQRFTSLATLFYLLTLFFYVRWRLAQPAAPARRLATYLPVLACALLAVKSKEIAFTLPAAAALYELSFLSRTSWRQRLLFLSPIAAAALLIPVTLLDLHQPVGRLLSDVSQVSSVQTSLSRLDYLRTQCAVLATYLRLLVLPVDQNLDYDYPLFHSFLSPRVFASLLLLLALLALAAFFFRASSPSRPSPLDPAFRLLAFGIAWFFLTLSVESSLIPIVDVIFEHRLYLPSAGAAVAVAVALLLLTRRLAPSRALALTLAVALALSSLLAAATFLRNRVWADDLSLWSDVVSKSPNKARGHKNLGVALGLAGQPEQAVSQLRLAAQLDPSDAGTLSNLGVTLDAMGRVEEARDALSRALQINPSHVDARFNLARLMLVRDGRTADAAAELERVLAAEPRNAGALATLAGAWNRLGRYADSIQLLTVNQAAVKDNAEACFNLAVAELAVGDREAAARTARDLERLSPTLSAQLSAYVGR